MEDHPVTSMRPRSQPPSYCISQSRSLRHVSPAMFGSSAKPSTSLLASVAGTEKDTERPKLMSLKR